MHARGLQRQDTWGVDLGVVAERDRDIDQLSRGVDQQISELPQNLLARLLLHLRAGYTLDNAARMDKVVGLCLMSLHNQSYPLERTASATDLEIKAS